MAEAKPLRIKRPIFAALVTHVQTCYPLEACGLLAGNDHVASHLYVVENQLHSPVEFLMNPLQQIQAMIDVENSNLQLLAIYHSHPQGPAQPSEIDVVRAYYPEVIHIIVSLADCLHPLARAFIITGETVRETDLVVE